MARPRMGQKAIVVQVKLSLRPGEDESDARLKTWFDSIPERLRAAAVKQALLAGGMAMQLSELPSDDEVEAALDALIG